MLDPISSNQAIGKATRPWITTPTARLSRIWAPTLDYSSMWGNWNFNLGPSDWDFLSISLLLTLTKTGQHSLPPHIWPQELRQGLLNSADGVLSLIPIMVRMAPRPTRLHTAHHLSPCYPMEGMHSLHHCTPYQWNTLFPLLPMVSHIGPREYASPAPMRHHNPFPLFHWPALNLPDINGCQVALCLLAAFAIRALPCHINMW